MDKFQFLLRPPPGMHDGTFAKHVKETLVASLSAREPAGLKITWTDSDPPRLSVIPFKRERLALVSVWEEDDTVPGWTDAWKAWGWSVAGYRVRATTPVGYQRDWPDGEATPGIGLLTLMNRNPGLEHDRFMREWHDKHTPMSLRIHPLWNYIRNVVEEPVLEGSPHRDGIVEEHFRQPGQLLNPVHFFGGPFRMWPNMVRVGLHVRTFIDMKTIETYLVSEICVRTPACP